MTWQGLSWREKGKTKHSIYPAPLCCVALGALALWLVGIGDFFSFICKLKQEKIPKTHWPFSCNNLYVQSKSKEKHILYCRYVFLFLLVIAFSFHLSRKNGNMHLMQSSRNILILFFFLFLTSRRGYAQQEVRLFPSYI